MGRRKPMTQQWRKLKSNAARYRKSKKSKVDMIIGHGTGYMFRPDAANDKTKPEDERHGGSGPSD